MPSIDRLLLPGETAVLVARNHWIADGSAVVFAGIAVAIAAALDSTPSGRNAAPLLMSPFLLMAGFRVLSIYTRLLAVTSQRIFVRTGIIARSWFECRLDQIESVELDVSLLGRMLRYGTVVIHGTGSSF